MTRLFIMFIVLFALLLSCSKQDENTTSTPTDSHSTKSTSPDSSAMDSASTQSSENSMDTAETPPQNTASMDAPEERAASGADETPAENSAANPPTQSAPIAQSSGETPVNNNNNALELARRSGCLACHAIDKKIIGPPWQAVADRYKGGDNVRERLVAKIKTGGRGNWTDIVGNVAMPPYSPRVNDENIGKLVDFILGLPK